MTRTHWELSELTLLESGTLHDVLAIRIRRFYLDHAVYPAVIFLTSDLRMAFTMELINLHGEEPDAAVQQPRWIEGFGNSIPLLYATNLPTGDYLHLVSRSPLIKEIL